MPILFITRHKIFGKVHLTVHTANNAALLRALPSAKILLSTDTTTLLEARIDSFKGREGLESLVKDLRAFYKIVEG